MRAHRRMRRILARLLRVLIGGMGKVKHESFSVLSGAGEHAGKRMGKAIEPENLVALLAKFGRENTGINIDSGVRLINQKLDSGEMLRATRLLENGEDLSAIGYLVNLLAEKGILAEKYISLRRLESMLNILDKGYDLDINKTSSEVINWGEISRIMYVLHMRGPIVKNGYVSRTGLVTKLIGEIGCQAACVTRLGFPSELKAYRHIPIEEKEQFGGVVCHSLNDEKNNLIYLPLDEYIDEYASRLMSLAVEGGFDVIHAASNYINGLAAIRAARKLNLPSIYEVRGLWHITKESNDPGYRETLKYELEEKMEVQCTREADRVITLSEELKKYFVDRGVSGKKIHVVPNGVDTDVFKPLGRDRGLMRNLGIEDRDVVIGYVGSLVFYEGLDDVIQSLSDLTESGVRNVKLLVVGDGIYRKQLISLAETLDVSGHCIFTGSVSPKEVQGYYSLIDIAPFVRKDLPVTRLVPPLKPMEAMAMEKCVVVSKLPALEEIGDDGISVFQVAASNRKQLADVLGELISNPSLRQEVAENGRQWVRENRSTQALSKRLWKVYHDRE